MASEVATGLGTKRKDAAATKISKKISTKVSTTTTNALPEPKPPTTLRPPMTLKMRPLELRELSEFLDDDSQTPECQIKEVERGLREMHKKFHDYEERYKKNVKKQRDMLQAMESRKYHAEHILAEQLAKTQNPTKKKYLASFTDGKSAEEQQKELKMLRQKLKEVEKEVQRVSDAQKKADREKTAERNLQLRHFRSEQVKRDKKLGNLLDSNKNLREEIRGLLMSRTRQMTYCQEKMDSLHELKKCIQEEVEEGNDCYDEKAKAEKKIALIDKKIELADELHRTAMTDAQIELSNLRQGFVFSTIKLDNRALQRHREFRKKHRGDDLETLKADQEACDYFETALNAVKDMANNKDIEVICSHFSENNADNHRLYKAILMYEEEIARIEKEKREMSFFIEKLKKDKLYERNDLHGRLEAADKEVVETAVKMEQLDKQVAKDKQIIEAVGTVIDSAFKNIPLLKSRSLKNLLLGSDMDFCNVGVHIEVLEKKTRRMMEIYKYYENSKQELHLNKTMTVAEHTRRSKIPQSILLKPVISDFEVKKEDQVFPLLDTECSWPEDSDEEDENQKLRFLTREELLRKAQEQVDAGLPCKKKDPKKRHYSSHRSIKKKGV